MMVAAAPMDCAFEPSFPGKTAGIITPLRSVFFKHLITSFTRALFTLGGIMPSITTASKSMIANDETIACDRLYPTPSKPRYAPTNTRNYDLKIGTDKGGLTVSATGNC
jgi:hypothetical protein